MALRECVRYAWEQGTSPLSVPSGVAVWTLGIAQHECLSPRVPSHLRFLHGRETGGASKHQILRQTRQIWSGRFWNVTTCVWKWDHVSCDVFRVALALQEAEHHSKTTRGQRDLPRAQPLKMWKQFVGLCMRIVGEQLRRLLQLLMCHTEQCRQFSRVIWTCIALLQSSAQVSDPEQKEHRVAICQELRQRALDDPSFMSRVITGNKSSVYGYDPETKQQSSQWKSPGPPRPKKARQSCSTTKSMLIVFFDNRGIVHYEFAPEGQTVNTKCYCIVLRRLREDIWQKRPELWRAGNWLLYDDNAPSHRALVTREFLAHNSIIALPYLPYSPDLAPCNFFLFLKMKLQLKGRRFHRVEKIQWESHNVLGMLREQDFQHEFQQWQRRWDRCVAAQGDYFEGMLPKRKSGTYIVVYRSSLGTFWYTLLCIHFDIT